MKGKYQHTRKTSGACKQYSNFKSMFFAFIPYSLLSMVEEGWLKMLGTCKRKFREVKTANEEKALLEIPTPKSTRYVTKWSFNISALCIIQYLQYIQKFGFINRVDNVNWPPYRDST